MSTQGPPGRCCLVSGLSAGSVAVHICSRLLARSQLAMKEEVCYSISLRLIFLSYKLGTDYPSRLSYGLKMIYINVLNTVSNS